MLFRSYLVDALTEGRWGHGPDIPYGGQPHPEGKGVWFDLPAGLAADAPVRRPVSP